LGLGPTRDSSRDGERRESSHDDVDAELEALVRAPANSTSTTLRVMGKRSSGSDRVQSFSISTISPGD
jgi:hypothetical protein